MKFYEAFATPVMLYNCKFSQTDQLRKMYSRGIHFDLKEEHLEGHIALNKANLQKKKGKKKGKKRKKKCHRFFSPSKVHLARYNFRKPQLDLQQARYNFRNTQLDLQQARYNFRKTQLDLQQARYNFRKFYQVYTELGIISENPN